MHHLSIPPDPISITSSGVRSESSVTQGFQSNFPSRLSRNDGKSALFVGHAANILTRRQALRRRPRQAVRSGSVLAFTLQSDTDRRKFGSFLVPLTSSFSLGFCPGTMGAQPVFQMVYSPPPEEGEDEVAAAAGSGLEPPATEKPMVVAISDENPDRIHSLRLNEAAAARLPSLYSPPPSRVVTAADTR